MSRTTKTTETTFIRTAKADVRDLLQVEIGDSKQAEFYPQVKVMRWDNEVNLSVRLITDDAAAVVTEPRGGAVKWDCPKIAADFYEIAPNESFPEGATEFDITLKEAPATNVLEFSLNTKGVEFFYQPPLTEAEIAAGGRQKEGVAGSYAVYAETPKTNIRGGKLYRSGKVGHIYRPRIEDANGEWTWGDLNIENGILTVTIPQKFLDKAAYPIRHAAGLTIGYTTAGGNFASFNSSARASVNIDTPGVDGVGVSMSAASDNFASPHGFKGALWRTSDKSLIANSVTPASTNFPAWPNWRTVAYVTPPEIAADEELYIGALTPSVSEAQMAYDVTGSGGGDTAHNYTTPTTLGTLSNTTRRYSVYLTFDEVVEGGQPIQRRMANVPFMSKAYSPGIHW